MAFRSAEQIESLIGEKIRDFRLNKNIPQAELAEKAGITRTVLQRLEDGKPVKLRTLINVMKALRLEDWFETIAQFSTVNPLLLVDDEPRQRARKKKVPNGP